MMYAKKAGAVTWSQGLMAMRSGQSFDNDHPLVAERPDLFTDVEPGAEVKTPGIVRSAMQRPGEVRVERVASVPETPAAPVVQAPPRASSTDA